jgi:hypothetical protein
MAEPLDRRRFLCRTAAGALAAGLAAGCVERRESADPPAPPPKADADDDVPAGPRPDYPADRPNVVLVRFGGGVRRRETVAFPDKTWCPFILHELAGKQGVLFKNVEISSAPGVVTSHGQNTLYMMTGQYAHYEDVYRQPLAERFEAPVPTIFEYLRKAYNVAEQEALIVNGEDRINEEFFTFSNHHLFGVNYRSTVLSLYGYKTFLLREELKNDKLQGPERAEKEKKLAEMLNKDYRVPAEKREQMRNPGLEAFWERWRDCYGTTGLVNPRGDRLLTALALRALKELRPRLMMINYQDPDYVHWGNPNFYTRAIAIIDEGVRELHEAVQADEFYRDNTVFLVLPDCGRDDNRGMAVPYQHHFNSKCAHEIFAVLAGPEKHLGGLRRGGVVGRAQEQICAAATVGELMGFATPHADAASLLKVV